MLREHYLVIFKLMILLSVHFCRAFDEEIPRFLEFFRVNILLIFFNFSTDFIVQHHFFGSYLVTVKGVSGFITASNMASSQQESATMNFFIFQDISFFLHIFLSFSLTSLNIMKLKTLKISQTLEKQSNCLCDPIKTKAFHRNT